jgi:hypothetical protein
MTAWVGVFAIALVDVVLPAMLAAWLIGANVRGHRSHRHELSFWTLCLLPMVFLVPTVARGIAGVVAYDGSAVYTASVLALPGLLVPVIATIVMSGAFFDDATWASIGYFAVMPTYLVGLVLWQLVVITGLRRLIQRGRRRPTSRRTIRAADS